MAKTWIRCCGWLIGLALGCGGPPELAFSGPEAVTVFAGGTVQLAVRLGWEGSPRPLTLAGTAAPGLSVTPVEVPAGPPQATLTLTADSDAEPGQLVLHAAGEEVEEQLTVPVQVARARVISAPSSPLLRGATVPVVVEFSGGTPTFEQVVSAEPVAGVEGQWKVVLAIPADAAPGEQALSFRVRCGDAEQTLQSPLAITDTVRLTARESLGGPVAGHAVWLNSTGPVVTDAEGRASFSGVAAPYRLTSKASPDATSAQVYEGATLAAPVLRLSSPTVLPARSLPVSVRLVDPATGELLSGHQYASVHAMVEGMELTDMVYLGPSAEKQDTLDWNGPASLRTRLRAVARLDGKLVRMSEQAQTLVDGAPEEYLPFQMHPTTHGSIHTEVVLPPGFSINGRVLYGIFSGNEFDQLLLQQDNAPVTHGEMTGAILRDDLRHSLQLRASNLAGDHLIAMEQGLAIGDTLRLTLAGPPALQGVTGQINDATVYPLSGASWPVYSVGLTVGEPGLLRTETLYTSRSAPQRPGVVSFQSGAPGTLRICGSSFVGSVDELLDGSPGGFTGTNHPAYPGALGCATPRDVTYTAGP